MDWTVEYYRDLKGNEPAVDFIDSLPVETQAKVLRTMELLARYGVLLKDVEVKNEKREVTAKTHL